MHDGHFKITIYTTNKSRKIKHHDFIKQLPRKAINWFFSLKFTEDKWGRLPISCHSRLPLYENGFLPNESRHQPVGGRRRLQSSVYITYSYQAKFLNYIWAAYCFQIKGCSLIAPWWKEGVWPACGPALFWPHPACHDSLHPPTVWLGNSIDGYTLCFFHPLFSQEVSENWYRLDSEVKTHKFDLRYGGTKVLVFHLTGGSSWRSEQRLAIGNVLVLLCSANLFWYSYVTLKGKAPSHFKMTSVDLILYWKWWRKHIKMWPVGRKYRYLFPSPLPLWLL